MTSRKLVIHPDAALSALNARDREANGPFATGWISARNQRAARLRSWLRGWRIEAGKNPQEPDPFSGSRGWLGRCLTVGGRIGEPPNRQRAALFNQDNDSLNHCIASKSAPRIGLEFASAQRQRLCQSQNVLFGLCLGKPGTFCKLTPVLRLDFAEFVLAADFHRHLGRQCWIHRYRERVVERGQGGCLTRVQQREILGMRIMIPDQRRGGIGDRRTALLARAARWTMQLRSAAIAKRGRSKNSVALRTAPRCRRGW